MRNKRKESDAYNIKRALHIIYVRGAVSQFMGKVAVKEKAAPLSLLVERETDLTAGVQVGQRRTQ